MDDMQAIAAAFRALRALRGYTQPELAQRIGIGEQALRSIERATHDRPRMFALALCNAVGVTIEEYKYVVALYSASASRLAAIEAEA